MTSPFAITTPPALVQNPAPFLPASHVAAVFVVDASPCTAQEFQSFCSQYLGQILLSLSFHNEIEMPLSVALLTYGHSPAASNRTKVQQKFGPTLNINDFLSFCKKLKFGIGNGGLLRNPTTNGLVAALEMLHEYRRNVPCIAQHIVLISSTANLPVLSQYYQLDKLQRAGLDQVADFMLEENIRLSVICLRKGIADYDALFEKVNANIPQQELPHSQYKVKLAGFALVHRPTSKRTITGALSKESKKLKELDEGKASKKGSFKEKAASVAIRPTGIKPVTSQPSSAVQMTSGNIPKSTPNSAVTMTNVPLAAVTKPMTNVGQDPSLLQRQQQMMAMQQQQLNFIQNQQLTHQQHIARNQQIAPVNLTTSTTLSVGSSPNIANSQQNISGMAVRPMAQPATQTASTVSASPMIGATTLNAQRVGATPVWSGQLVWAGSDGTSGVSKELSAAIVVNVINNPKFNSKAESFFCQLWPQRLFIHSTLAMNTKQLLSTALEQKIPVLTLSAAHQNDPSFQTLLKALVSKQLTAIVRFSNDPASHVTGISSPAFNENQGMILCPAAQGMIGLVFIGVTLASFLSSHPHIMASSGDKSMTQVGLLQQQQLLAQQQQQQLLAQQQQQQLLAQQQQQLLAQQQQQLQQQLLNQLTMGSALPTGLNAQNVNVLQNFQAGGLNMNATMPAQAGSNNPAFMQNNAALQQNALQRAALQVQNLTPQQQLLLLQRMQQQQQQQQRQNPF